MTRKTTFSTFPPITIDDLSIPPHLERDRTEDCLVGKDPRQLSASDLESLDRPRISRGDAIRAKCLDCVGDSPIEVRRCGMADCALWPFRMGTDPYREPMSEDRRAKAGARLGQARWKPAAPAEVVP